MFILGLSNLHLPTINELDDTDIANHPTASDLRQADLIAANNTDMGYWGRSAELLHEPKPTEVASYRVLLSFPRQKEWGWSHTGSSRSIPTLLFTLEQLVLKKGLAKSFLKRKARRDILLSNLRRYHKDSNIQSGICRRVDIRSMEQDVELRNKHQYLWELSMW